MAAKVETQNEISLNGVYYPLTRPVQTGLSSLRLSEAKEPGLVRMYEVMQRNDGTQPRTKGTTQRNGGVGSI